MTPLIDLSTPRRLHVIGAGGVGMSAVAAVLAGMGNEVTGSDLKESRSLDRVRAAGVDVRVGHSADNVGDVDAVTISSAVPESNLEVEVARSRGIPVLSRAEMLAAISATRRTLAVAGTHGKTTTASMLSLILVEAGARPSFLIGGELNEIGTGAVWDEGAWLVLEADESDGSFLALEPEVAVVTNVEPDHLEHYDGYKGLEGAFDAFLGQVTGPLVVCADDDTAVRLGRAHDAVTFGTSESATFRVCDFRSQASGVSFGVVRGDERVVDLSLPVLGVHNALNACGATVAALEAGAEPDDARRALARFAGVARRFQHRGLAAGVTYVDDYAHLPGEVAAALEAAGEGEWARVICVFQPHRYSRTASLWADFANAFSGADVVLVTDVYAAGEAPRPGVSGELVADAVRRSHPEIELHYVASRLELVERLRHLLRPGDLCLTLGAGDLTSLPDELMVR
jgi:UDP-N-acetylmuramate--alanine ligase